MRYLHTMVRVSDEKASLDFYCNKLGMVEIRRYDSEAGRFTNIPGRPGRRRHRRRHQGAGARADL